MEYVEFRSVRSRAAFLQVASKLLVTIGTNPRARIRISDIPELIEKQTAGKKPGVMLVIGNEETGLPAEVKEQCSMLARVPGTGVLESLNAGQATALFLHELYERCA
jgi:tRNA G18 (ribose-2'-O)-methylase SpoU